MEFLRDIHLRELPNDVFYTPRDLARSLIEMVDFDSEDFICDPFKGKGAFFDQIKSKKKDWQEINLGRDFFEYDEIYDWIISNPPFSKTNQILEETVRRSRKGFAYIFPTYQISYRRLKMLESFGFYLNKIVYFQNPKEWNIGFQMAFYIFKKKRSDSIKLVDECNSIQLRLI